MSRLLAHRRMARRVLLAASVTFGLLAIAEALLRVLGVAAESAMTRLVGIDQNCALSTFDADTFWRLSPRTGYDPVDETGVRGEMFTMPKHPRDLRVLCVGDSCAYGLFVRLEESFGVILDRRLQTRFPAANVETVLAAAPGWSSFQDLRFWQRHERALEPDVTILYVGAWNDMVPASRCSDAGFAAEIDLLERHPVWSLRLGRLLWRATHRFPAAESVTSQLEAARATGATLPTRVGVEELRANVRGLVALARASGVVVAIVPSIENSKTWITWTGPYRDALLDVYRDLAVPCVDSDVHFAACATRPSAWKPQASLIDGIHPSGAGHAALADALEPLVCEAAAVRLRALAGACAPEGASISSVEPRTVGPGRRTRFQVRGSGFRGQAPPLRVLAGGYSIHGFEVVDDSTITFEAEPEFLCRPGPLSIAIRSRAGERAAPAPPEVLPWAPRVTLEDRDGRRTLRASVDCDGALAVSAWVAPALLDEPRATRWGPFVLAIPGRDHADAPFEDPLGFPGLDLPVAFGFRHQPGPSPMRVDTGLPVGIAPSGRMFAQVLIRFGLAAENAWLSGAIEVTRDGETR